MRMTHEGALDRLRAHDHGVLCTLHPERGIDAVPVVYAVDADGFVAVPIDLVKPKSSTRLQRERNLETDSRATLLAEHWDAADWSRLWWVRATLQHEPDAARADALITLLAAKYPQYAEPTASIARVLVLRITGLTGWLGDDG